jgi:hypothetical protein
MSENVDLGCRKCGSCTACCTWLGVEELRKYTGEKCEHLRVVPVTKRCSIYHNRPGSCARYKCLWLAGFGEEELRPNKSGILITPYPMESSIALTVNIFNIEKASKHIDAVIAKLLAMPHVVEVRAIYIRERRALLFTNGNIFEAKLLPSQGYEDLRFAASAIPIGQYITPGQTP